MKTNKLTPGANLRWESSRMMLPEHVAELNKHRVDLFRVEKPTLDVQEIEEISYKLADSLEHHSPLSLQYYQSGYINEINGIVTKLDPLRREVTITDYEYERHKLNFDSVLNIEAH